jgi:segregation and condensation protein B
MGVTLSAAPGGGKRPGKAKGEKMRNLFRPSNPLLRALPARERLPSNHRLPLVYRPVNEGPAEAPLEGEFARSPRLALVEAVLIVADEPLTVRRLGQAAGLKDTAEARTLVRQLQELYEHEGSAFEVVEVAGGFQLLTRAEVYPWLVRLRKASSELRLTAAARETLAIIAYRQPIMRADIEAIRGVQCADVLRQLMEKNLIRIAGRDDSLGRPVLYGTTKKFLQLMGLRSLRELPRADEFKRPGRPAKATPEEDESGS